MGKSFKHDKDDDIDLSKKKIKKSNKSKASKSSQKKAKSSSVTPPKIFSFFDNKNHLLTKPGSLQGPVKVPAPSFVNNSIYTQPTKHLLSPIGSNKNPVLAPKPVPQQSAKQPKKKKKGSNKPSLAQQLLGAATGNSTNNPNSLGAALLSSPTGSINTPTSSGSISDLLSSNNVGITSFDIEATGVPGSRANITQIGYVTEDFDKIDSKPISGTSGKEYTIHGAYQQKYSNITEVPQELRQDIIDKAKARGISTSDYLSLPTEEDLIEAHRLTGAEEFGRQQAEKGSFKSILEDYNRDFKGINKKTKEMTFDPKGKVKDLNFVIKELEDTLKGKSGVFLVQNINYENKMFSEHIGVGKDPQVLSAGRAESFSQSIFGRRSSRDIFFHTGFSSTYVTPVKSTIFRLKKYPLENLDSDEVKGLLNTLSEQTTKLQEAYRDRIKSAIDSNKSVTADLMDFTTILQNRLIESPIQSKLEKHGIHLTPHMLGRNMKVDLLSQVLLGEEETHTAMSDADQQARVFKKILKMTEEVEKGVLSTDTLKYAKEISNPDNFNKNFLETLKSQLTDINNKVIPLLDKDGTTQQEIDELISKEVNKKLQIVEDTYRYTPSGDLNREELLTSIKGYLFDVNATGESNPLLLQEEVDAAKQAIKQNSPPHHNSMPTHSSPSVAVLNSQERLNNIIQSAQKQLNHPKGIGTIGQRLTPPSVTAATAQSKLIQNKPNFTNVPSSVGKWGLGAIGAFAFVNLMLGESGEREHKELVKNDTFDALYDDLYTGQAYADWKERNNSHKMIY